MNESPTRLRKRELAALFGLGLLVFGLASRWIASPGYMDADYYFATGREIADGNGFSEPFLWNYLDDPAGIPHPSHLYWMPLPSLVAAFGAAVLGPGFRAAQLPFVAVAALLPPVVAQISLQLTKNASNARRAGVLAAFPGFYLPFLVTTDAFGLYALAGGLALWTIASAAGSGRAGRQWLLAGALIGLANLTRADAPLLLLTGLACATWGNKHRARSVGLLLAGYLLLIAPWSARNLAETGAVLNRGSSRLFWLLSYDDLFSYPASLLTFDRWQAAGLGAALGARLEAVATNLQRLLAEGGLVYLWPFVLIGGWRHRRHAYVRVGAVYLALLVLAMSIVYPFVGARGGLFHSASAVLPAIWALAPAGVAAATLWAGKVRSWNLPQAGKVFGSAAVALAGLLTVGLFVVRQVGPAAEGAGWNAASRDYRRAAAVLPPGSDEVVAVNNPPGFALQSGRASIVIPNGSPSVLRAAAERYGAGWVVLETNHPQGLDRLYQSPESETWLRVDSTIADSRGNPVYILQVVGP